MSLNEKPTVRRTPFWRFSQDGKMALEKVALIGLASIIFLSALEAYAVFSIPVPWMGMVLTLVVAISCALVPRGSLIPGSAVFMLLGLWLLIVTFIVAARVDYSVQMPEISSTPYPVFIALRFIKFFAFIALAQLVYRLCVMGNADAVVRVTVSVGTLISIYAIYVYFGSKFGLPEIPRLQIGTGAKEISQLENVTSFMRALGTFREPGPYAVWLFAPLLLSFSIGRSPFNVHSIIMGIAFLLTGSLTGVAAIVLGLVAAYLISNPLRPKMLKHIVIGAVIFGAGLLVMDQFMPIARPWEGETVSLSYWNRIEPLFRLGFEGTNRDYTFLYVINHPLPDFGVGLGHANLDFSGALLSSLLSLYFNIWLSGGFLGALLLGIFLFQPLVIFVVTGVGRAAGMYWLVAAYLAWLVAYAVQPEEFQPMFAVVYGLFIYRISHVYGSRCRP